MLLGLSHVDWSALSSSSGDGREVPRLLEAAGATGGTAKLALTQLRREILTEHEVWETSSETVPFLVQLLLTHEDPSARPAIVELLHDLGVGRLRGAFPQHLNFDELNDQADRAEPPAGGVDEDADDFGFDDDDVAPARAERQWLRPRWQRDCALAVELSLPALTPLLDDVDDELVSRLIALFGPFRTAANHLAPALWKLAREEDDSVLGPQALVALAQLGVPGASEAARVASDQHVDTQPGLYAAVADILASVLPTPSSIHTVVGTPKAWHAQFCPFVGTVERLQRRVLRSVPLGARALVVQAFERGNTELPRLVVAQLLLRFANITNVNALDEVQRSALALVAQRGPWSRVELTDMLDEIGLPATQGGLRAHLAQTK